MKIIDQMGGLIIYHFNHEGRGIGFLNKLKTYKLMDEENKTTYDAFKKLGHQPEQRNFQASLLILKDLGIKQVRLLTNNPFKFDSLQDNGIQVTEVVPLVHKQPYLRNYLLSKQKQFGHWLDLEDKQIS